MLSLEKLRISAEQAFRVQDLRSSEKLCKTILASAPGDVHATILLAMILARTGRLPAGVQHLNNVLERLPECREAELALIAVLGAAGKIEEARAVAERAALRSPADAEMQNEIGLCLVQFKLYAEAASCFRAAHEANPKDAGILQNLASCLKDAGLEVAAVEAWKDFLLLMPESASGWLRLGQLHLMHGRCSAALECASKSCDLESGNANAHLLKAMALAELGRGREAEPELAQAIAINPKDGVAHASLGFWLQEQGRFEEADISLRQAIELRPSHGFAYYNLFRSRKVTEGDRAFVDRLQSIVGDGKTPARDRVYMHYALGKAFEDLGEFEMSMRSFDEGNVGAYRIWLENAPWDREKYSAGFDESIAAFTSESFQQARSRIYDPKPLIIVGMIRSGTSLVEQILSSHPDVVGAGELPYWHQQEAILKSDPNSLERVAAEYLRELEELAPGSKRVTDKLPHNYAFLGQIHTALPLAKIIHVRRSPLDNCLSVYTTAYQRPPSFAHRKSNIVWAYREYLRLMAHWRDVLPTDAMLEVDYEDLVGNRDVVTRRMIEFAGLEWRDDCLRHETNVRSVRTPSLWQVRQPIYQTSIERWKRFEPWLGDLLDLREP